MHTREFFYDNYRHHPDPVLRRIAGEYSKLTPVAQEALRDVLRERKMDDLLAPLDVEEKQKRSLAHLSADEVRAMINSRLDRGEKIESIKIDLQDKGVNIFELSSRESRTEEAIDERFVQLSKEGKSKAEIDQHLKNEFNLSEKASAKIPERMHSDGAWLIVAGGVLLMVFIPLIAVALQSPGRTDLKYPILAIAAGAGLMIIGLRKRMAARKFIRESGTEVKD